jgi:23S rRNA (cytidine1920-2'-O)/16S rRNA (cytidine1409-2'-O)-methyltransferase
MARRNRLDTELVRRGLARSRDQAAELLASGRVEVRGAPATKPAAMVDPADPVRVREAAGEEYVSRGGHKLAGALAAFAPAGLGVAGRRCLDAGASTGGFTDVLLRGGAAAVVAVDVGYGQLAWTLRNDARVTVLERTNVRMLTPEAVGGTVDLVVADLSFISLRLVLEPVRRLLASGGRVVALVKPQFEAGRADVPRSGVVRDAAVHRRVLVQLAGDARKAGLEAVDLVASPRSGRQGNREFLALLRAADPDGPQPPAPDFSWSALVDRALEPRITI